MFYNDNQKERYLEKCKYHPSTVETIRVIFNNTAPVERHYDTDLSLFNGFQILDLLKKFNSTSRKYLNTICAQLSDYYNWCSEENLIPLDFGNPYDTNRVRRIIEKIVPDELLENKFFSYNTFISYVENVIDVSNKFVAYSIYLGITQDELVNLKFTDFNEKRKTVRLNTGRFVNVDDLFIDLIKKTHNTKYYYPEGVVESSKLGLYTYPISDYVLKTCVRGKEYHDKPMKKEAFSVRLRLIKEQSGNPLLTMTTIYKNGLVNYIKSKYAERNISLKEGIFSKINGMEYRYEKDTQLYIEEFGSRTTSRMLRNEIKDYIDVF